MLKLNTTLKGYIVRKVHIVWNGDQTEGFITLDRQDAYEARKGSDTNVMSPIGKAFCEATIPDNCVIQTLEIPEPPTYDEYRNR